MRKLTILSLLMIALLFFVGNSFLAAQTDNQTNNDEAKKAALKSYIELLDSGDYVIILRNNKKVRVREKPEVTESDLVWMYVKKKTGQFNRQSINKGIIDFEQTEIYNSKLAENRKVRAVELKRIQEEKEKALAAQRLEEGKIQGASGDKRKVYTIHDIKGKTASSGNQINVDSVMQLIDLPDFAVVIDPDDSIEHKERMVTVSNEKGETMLYGPIKDYFTVKVTISEQVKAYNDKITDWYDKGAQEGDKYKYASTVVEIQNYLASLKKMEVVIDKIISKFPPVPVDEIKEQ